MPARPIDFWALVDTSGECWMWTGRLDASGYGRAGKRDRAHRRAYELLVGPIPAGMDLDHLCHGADEQCIGGTSCPHRRCVNPAHLEPVTRAENVRRGRSFAAANGAKDRCPNGHEYTVENTYIWDKTGWRSCRACQAQRRAA